MCDDEDAVVVDTDDLEMLNEALPLPPGIVIPGEPKAKCDLDSVCDDDDVVVVDLNNLEMLNDILPIPLGVVIPGEPKASSFHISSIIRHEGADVSNLDELKRMNETFPLNPDISDVIPKESQQKQKQQQVSKTLGPNDKSGETQSSKVFTPVKGHPKLSEAEFSSCTVGENEIKEDKKIEKKQKRGLQVQSSVLKDEETAFDTQSSQPKLRTGINRSRKRSIFPLQRKRSSSGHSERREASGEDPNVNNSQRPRRGWRAVLKLFCFGSNDNNGNERTSASKRMFNRPVSPQAPTEIGLYWTVISCS